MSKKRHKIQGYWLEELISGDQIRTIVNKLARQIEEEYEGEELLLVIIIKGAIIFAADLQRAIDPNKVRVTIDFMQISSYGSGTESSRAPRIILDLLTNIEGKNVLIVEDIADTRFSLQKLIELLRTRNPRSLRVCVLLNKSARKEVEVHLDFVGIDIDGFVVGYGLDHDQNLRNLSYIAEVIEEPN